MKMKISFYLLLLCSLTGLGCSSSTQPVTIGAAMTGSVQFYDTNTGQIDSTGSDATVWLQGTSFRGRSDNQGNWTISGIPPGVYTIMISKEGYDTATVFNHKFIGAGVDFIDPVLIHLLATGTLTLDSLSLLSPQSPVDEFM